MSTVSAVAVTGPADIAVCIAGAATVTPSTARRMRRPTTTTTTRTPQFTKTPSLDLVAADGAGGVENKDRMHPIKHVEDVKAEKPVSVGVMEAVVDAETVIRQGALPGEGSTASGKFDEVPDAAATIRRRSSIGRKFLTMTREQFRKMSIKRTGSSNSLNGDSAVVSALDTSDSAQGEGSDGGQVDNDRNTKRKNTLRRLEKLTAQMARHRPSLSETGPGDSGKSANVGRSHSNSETVGLHMLSNPFATLRNFRRKSKDVGASGSAAELSFKMAAAAVAGTGGVEVVGTGGDKKEEGKIFGHPLEQVVEGQEQKVPEFFLQCLKYIEERGIRQVGIYRLSGRKTDVDALKAALQQEGRLDLTCMEASPNSVTGVVKLFLRQLPEPLLPAAAMRRIKLLLEMERDVQLAGVKEVLSALPPSHFATLAALSHHMARVAQHSEHNSMPISNLAVVIGPNIVPQCATAGPSALDSMKVASLTAELLVTECNVLFPRA
eukprot:comp24023_c1_seq1/m.42962 comp24023_c1_seq1/g.42962  ORF comp24023_c1_seq1/g.42962 comp24023_c1_seq1/m.42962 type:complete len:493 (-) comp24023_c1_seq1:499-1977(-)